MNIKTLTIFKEWLEENSECKEDIDMTYFMRKYRGFEANPSRKHGWGIDGEPLWPYLIRVFGVTIKQFHYLHIDNQRKGRASFAQRIDKLIKNKGRIPKGEGKKYNAKEEEDLARARVNPYHPRHQEACSLNN